VILIRPTPVAPNGVTVDQELTIAVVQLARTSELHSKKKPTLWAKFAWIADAALNSPCPMVRPVNVTPNLPISAAPNGASAVETPSIATAQPVSITNWRDNGDVKIVILKML